MANNLTKHVTHWHIKVPLNRVAVLFLPQHSHLKRGCPHPGPLPEEAQGDTDKTEWSKPIKLFAIRETWEREGNPADAANELGSDCLCFGHGQQDVTGGHRPGAKLCCVLCSVLATRATPPTRGVSGIKYFVPFFLFIIWPCLLVWLSLLGLHLPKYPLYIAQFVLSLFLQFFPPFHLNSATRFQKHQDF